MWQALYQSIQGLVVLWLVVPKMWCPQASSISRTWKLATNANSWVTPQNYLIRSRTEA